MSAAARGAAGARFMRDRKRNASVPIVPRHNEVEAFVVHLMSRFNVSEARARELAAEQQAKTFNRATGARR